MKKRTIQLILAMVLICLLAAPVIAEIHHQEKFYTDVLLENVPHIRQKPDFCGEACAEMYLRKLGGNIDQDYVFDQSDVDPLQARGCFTPELANALKKIGFEVGKVWYNVSADKAEEYIEKQFEALHADLIKGIPSIVCMHYDDRIGASEHFRLILGYDSNKDEVIYHEPAEQSGAYQRMKREVFLKLWPLKYNPKQWTLVQIVLKAGQIKNTEPVPGFTNADYAQHVMNLNTIIPSQTFTVVLQKPFVVIGDEQPALVRQRAVATIKWAVDMLKQDYFKKDPDKIIDIWLFKDEKSYKKYTKQIFNDTPGTPFGYYSSEHSSLMMNIATGGGTLVHEIVHPFMSSNFPQCPAWFNEGLASLYEQSSEKNNRIYGLVNWRLAGLQECILSGTIPSFKTLMQSGNHRFYMREDGDNYAQARYLCYYLQEKDLLVKFYNEFYSGRTSNPTGFETLKKVLGEKDMEAFQKRWEKYVLNLTPP